MTHLAMHNAVYRGIRTWLAKGNPLEDETVTEFRKLVHVDDFLPLIDAIVKNLEQEAGHDPR